MELFDKKFVHFMWDAELEGKECFIADSIDELESRVNENDSAFLCRAQYSGCKSYPFYEDKYNWKFAYYDPNYALKIACHEGRQIQCRQIGYENWVDTPKPCWDNKHWEYRVKSTKRRMTNRELAKWLAEGNGQLKLRSGDKTTLYDYCGKDEAFITEGWTIREWDSDEWREPEVEE